jgi:hypothetical protein
MPARQFLLRGPTRSMTADKQLRQRVPGRSLSIADSIAGVWPRADAFVRPGLRDRCREGRQAVRPGRTLWFVVWSNFSTARNAVENAVFRVIGGAPRPAREVGDTPVGKGLPRVAPGPGS